MGGGPGSAPGGKGHGAELGMAVGSCHHACLAGQTGAPSQRNLGCRKELEERVWLAVGTAVLVSASMRLGLGPFSRLSSRSPSSSTFQPAPGAGGRRGSLGLSRGISGMNRLDEAFLSCFREGALGVPYLSSCSHSIVPTEEGRVGTRRDWWGDL